MTTNGMPSTMDTELFREDLEDNMRYLRKNLRRLPSSDSSFAKSLCDNWEKHDRLTVKQIPYALRLWRNCKNLEAIVGVAKSDSGQMAVKLDTSKLLALFDKARDSGIRFPRITVEGICIFPRVNVNSGNIAFKKGILLLAEIDREGVLRWKPDAKIEERQEIAKILKSPVEHLTAVGKKYINCCFCGIDLSTNESRFAGYGPICASKWGLPWGETTISLEDL